MGIHGGKRLIKKNHLRLIGHNPGQGHPLLLAARELSRVPLLQTRETEALNHFPRPSANRLRRERGRPPASHCLSGPFSFKACHDIFFHRHIGEEGIILKEIAHAPGLGALIDFQGGIKQYPSACRLSLGVLKGDASGIRSDNTRD